MPLPQKRLIPGFLLLLMLAAFATPPLWWKQGNPAVIVENAPENHHGPANIGQTKHIISKALEALDDTAPSVALLIRNDLATTHPSLLTVPANKTPEWMAQQKAPLLIGQLKALAHPFYSRLNEANAEWVLQQIQLNHNGTAIEGTHYWHVTHTEHYQDGYYPWNPATPPTQNKAIATIGQLKAVFSLRFETLPPPDSDGDGMDDAWELVYDLNPADAADAVIDSDQDGVSNLDEYTQGTNPRISNTANRKIWNFRKKTNADGTITYTWNSYAKNGDWFHIESLQPDQSWKRIYSTTYGSSDLPFVANSVSYSITLDPTTDFLQ